MELLARTQVGRDINRRYYERSDIERAMGSSVVQDLLRLMRLRNEHTAFSGTFELLDSDPETLALRWQQGAEFAQLKVHLPSAAFELLHSSGPDTAQWRFASGQAGDGYGVQRSAD
jgi:sucrose phosphorylase